MPSVARLSLREVTGRFWLTLDKPPPRGTAITEENQADFKSAELKDFELYNLRDDIGEAHERCGEPAPEAEY